VRWVTRSSGSSAREGSAADAFGPLMLANGSFREPRSPEARSRRPPRWRR
jgi:hypothetical protein